MCQSLTFFGSVPFWKTPPTRVQAPTSIGGSVSGRVAGIASAAVGGLGAASIADDAAGAAAAGGGAGGGGAAGGGGSACAIVPPGVSVPSARAAPALASAITSANPALP